MRALLLLAAAGASNATSNASTCAWCRDARVASPCDGCEAQCPAGTQLAFCSGTGLGANGTAGCFGIGAAAATCSPALNTTLAPAGAACPNGTVALSGVGNATVCA